MPDGHAQRAEAQTATRIAELQAAIAKKDRIISEVSEENLDKKGGGP